jgi:oligopeptide transport system ATP-binding protein
MSEHLLEVRNLKTYFYTESGIIRAVDDVSFHVDEGETLGLVGESGCGKSVTALSLMRLIATPPGRIVGGEILFEGRNVLELSDVEMRGLCGDRIGMVFQEPMTSLNPVLTIGRQLREPLELHLGLTAKAAMARAEELLRMVGIADPKARLGAYPHQLSGGQRQRVMIAIALGCNPKLLIADEATTALDVTIQAQILELMKELTAKLRTALIIITHNLGLVARYADRVNVMYAGRIRESGKVDDIYAAAGHPYTVGLLNSVPRLDQLLSTRLKSIRGEIPDLASLPSGCAFRSRCDWAVDRCTIDDPPLMPTGPDHWSACWEHARVTAAGVGEP